MFETLFSCPSALRRHREGPLAAERAAHLRSLAAKGMARSRDRPGDEGAFPPAIHPLLLPPRRQNYNCRFCSASS
jgi:hypothetical protein